MSVRLVRIARTALRPAATVPRPAAAACAPRFYSSAMHDNDPEVLETEKQRNLSNNQHKTSTTVGNAPGWNEDLASTSEANVKADRSEIPLSELEESTIQHIHERHHGAEPLSNGEGTIDSSEAVYERDEVSGPLKGAPAHETTERDEQAGNK